MTTKDEMKNRISMALKDPILQQGFEIICKENELLKCRTEGFEKQILGLLYKYESVYKRFPDLKDAMNKAESILKENAELKGRADKADLDSVLFFNQLCKAKKIILKLYNAGRDVLMCRAEEKAYDNLSNAINDKSIEQFLSELEEMEKEVSE